MRYGTDTRRLARIAVAVAGGLVLFFVFGWIAILAIAAIAFIIFRKQKMVVLQTIGITAGIMRLIMISLNGYWDMSYIGSDSLPKYSCMFCSAFILATISFFVSSVNHCAIDFAMPFLSQKAIM